MKQIVIGPAEKPAMGQIGINWPNVCTTPRKQASIQTEFYALGGAGDTSSSDPRAVERDRIWMRKALGLLPKIAEKPGAPARKRAKSILSWSKHGILTNKEDKENLHRETACGVTWFARNGTQFSVWRCVAKLMAQRFGSATVNEVPAL